MVLPDDQGAPGIRRRYEPRRRSVPSTRARTKERGARAPDARKVPEFQASDLGHGGGRDFDWCRGNDLDLPAAGVAWPLGDQGGGLSDYRAVLSAGGTLS